MGYKHIIKNILIGKSLKITLIRAACIAVILVIVFKFILLPVRIYGKSMEPTFMDGSFIIINALKYRSLPPERGDIIAIRMAGRSIMYLKRIIGMPGEIIAFRGGALIINGMPLPEPYKAGNGPWDMDEIAIGADEYFVAGDNRSMPISEHSIGRVNKTKIAGGPLW